MLKINRVIEACIYAQDLAAMEKFYTTVLGLPLLSKEEGRHLFFRCGETMMLVFNPDKTTEIRDDVPPHGTYGEDHLALAIADSDYEKWRAHLISQGVEIEQENSWPGGGRSLYFRDPANNSIELATPQTWGFSK